MARSRVRIGDDVWALFVVVNTARSKGFPESVTSKIERLRRDPRTAPNVLKAGTNRIVVTPPVYDVIQCDIDTMGDATVSLFAADAASGERRVLLKDVPVRGKRGVKDDYDMFLRSIRF